MAQQTAVDWLKDMLEWNYGDPQMLEISWKNLDDLLERAKAMEKERENEIHKLKAIIEFYEQGCGLEGCKVIEPHVH
jgi:hypothetical protein